MKKIKQIALLVCLFSVLSTNTYSEEAEKTILITNHQCSPI